ncbi:MAG: putative transposase [Parcubacteria group bacterium Gr01-1014_44]|nr:MAG: putative transposase [Parcubacteria group bacterium Gr01-1014_44]
MDRTDYERFLALLYLCNSNDRVHLNDFPSSNLVERLSLQRLESVINICAYCLMPNHFHLLIQEKNENGISSFMQKLTTGYTMYFNKRNERNGALFQGRFKATHAKEDRYLKYLISYIHLNPIKIIDPKWKEKGIKDQNKAQNFLKQYHYSSYLDYCKKERIENKIITNTGLPEYFRSINNFETTTHYWLGDQSQLPEVEPRD